MNTQSVQFAFAIVLGRAGSKGLPGKNMLPIADVPCVQWTFLASQCAESVLHTCVSTDDPAMLELAREHGVITVERPAELATDTATVDDAARHAISAFGKLALDPRTPVVILYANIPVRPAGLIDDAVRLMLETGCDSVQSYSPVGKHHPWWTARLSEQGAVSPWEGDVLNHNVYRRQDLPPAYIPDGGVLVVSRQALMREIEGVPPGPHAFFGKDRRGIVSPSPVIDIDTKIDMHIADAILRDRLGNAGSAVT